MPIHDWTRVSAGIIHDFHQEWTIAGCATVPRAGLVRQCPTRANLSGLVGRVPQTDTRRPCHASNRAAARDVTL